jgi:hypothetical protein
MMSEQKLVSCLIQQILEVGHFIVLHMVDQLFSHMNVAAPVVQACCAVVQAGRDRALGDHQQLNNGRGMSGN